MGTWGLGPFENDTAGDFCGNVFDVIEGSMAKFQDLLKDGTPEGRLLRFSGFAQTRAGMVLLTALLRAGIEWFPSEDGAQPREWADTMLAFLEEHATPEQDLLKQAVRREVEDFLAAVSAHPLPRRPLPREGTVERRLREQRAPRDLCEWAHRFGADFASAWARCPSAQWLVHFATVLGVSDDRLLRAGCSLLERAAGEIPADETEAGPLVRAVFRAGAEGGGERLAALRDEERRLRKMGAAEREAREQGPRGPMTDSERARSLLVSTATRLLNSAVRSGKVSANSLAYILDTALRGPEALGALRTVIETPELTAAIARLSASPSPAAP